MRCKLIACGEKEREHLANVDPRFAAAIKRIGPIEREALPNLFTALCHSIVGQQISTKAQETVWERVLDLIDSPTPRSVLTCEGDLLRRCGLSSRKVAYLKSAAESFICGQLDESVLRTLSDEEVIQRLVALPGVGMWTAQMLLLFGLERPDVLCYEDFGLRNGCRILLELDTIDKPCFEAFRARCSPYGSTAALYLWEINQGK